MSTDDPDTHRLWFWTQRSWMHGPQVDDSFAVGPRAGNPLGSHFADKETVTGAPNIFPLNKALKYLTICVSIAFLPQDCKYLEAYLPCSISFTPFS